MGDCCTESDLPVSSLKPVPHSRHFRRQRADVPVSEKGILQSPCRPSQSGRSTPLCGHQPGFRPLLHRSSRGLGEERTFRFRLATVKKGWKRSLGNDLAATG